MNIINIVICLWLNKEFVSLFFFFLSVTSASSLIMFCFLMCFVLSDCTAHWPWKTRKMLSFREDSSLILPGIREERGQGTPATWNYLKANFSYIYIYPLIYLFLKYFIPWSILQPKDSLFSLLPKRQNTSYIYGSLPMWFFIQPFFFHNFESNYARRVSSTSCTSSFHNNCCKQGI